jgi:hypothetical protein
MALCLRGVDAQQHSKFEVSHVTFVEKCGPEETFLNMQFQASAAV